MCMSVSPPREGEGEDGGLPKADDLHLVHEATKYDMDNSELAKVILSRIQKLDPENALKIMGCIFLWEPTNQELVQLALGSDNMLVSRISDAKSMLSNSDMQFGSNHHGSYNSHVPKPYLNLQLVSGHCSPCKDLIVDEYSFDEHTNFLGLKEQLEIANQMENDCLPEVSLHGKLTLRTRRRSCSPSKSSKACHFFNKGFCKHGRSCRFLHEQSLSDGYPWIFIPDMNNTANCDEGATPRSLEKTEREIVELLRLKGPISIALLPKLYYDQYGKHLLNDWFLTESQRHDKTGFSLIKLLVNFKDSSIVIARKYGPVKDVRIPCQDKRMFGFVSFVRPETVGVVLMKGNPHFIDGARILVKPYKIKSRTTGRKQLIGEHEKMFEDDRMCLSKFNMASKTPTETPLLHYGTELKTSGHVKFPIVDKCYSVDAINTGLNTDDEFSNNCSDHDRCFLVIFLDKILDLLGVTTMIQQHQEIRDKFQLHAGRPESSARGTMSKGRSPEPLDFFIWTIEDVGLWLEEINLGSYCQVFKDNGVNGEYLECLSMFTTEQILRFIRRCHMKWGDFITLCKELRRIKVACLRGEQEVRKPWWVPPCLSAVFVKVSKRNRRSRVVSLKD
ncbi:zinc finger CCCH domain-containing protein [Musa troglodytarum]|uniref:Zinc finger CCCH domain-containing protein n=1 Tax=Musa troglodytarum TaxID=320322 RepID=A0A9E7HUZ1_9LILI|nr:zinc finger CCCH domain-containing protein [Musa troglodytarum]